MPPAPPVPPEAAADLFTPQTSSDLITPGAPYCFARYNLSGKRHSWVPVDVLSARIQNGYHQLQIRPKHGSGEHWVQAAAVRQGRIPIED